MTGRLTRSMSAPILPSPSPLKGPSPRSKTIAPKNHSPSKSMMSMVKKSQSQHQLMQGLLSKESSKSFESRLKSTPLSDLQDTSQELDSGLSGTELLSEVTKLSRMDKDLSGTAKLLKGDISRDTVRSTSKVGRQVNVLMGSSSEVTKGLDEIDDGLSTLDDLSGVQDFMHGKITVKSTKSVLKTTERVSDVMKLESVKNGTGKVMPMMSLVCSGQTSIEACQKLWDEPSARNLLKAGGSLVKTISDLKASLEGLPGGQILVKALDKLIGGSVPGLKALELGVAFEELVEKIQTAIDNPSWSNLGKAALEVLQFTGDSIGSLGIPGLSHLASGVSDVAKLLESAMDIDWGQTMKSVGETCSWMASSISSGIGSCVSWAFGW